MAPLTLGQARSWVAGLLEQFTVGDGSVVVMANRDYLAEVLVRELYLDEWFEEWDEPPAWMEET